MTSLHVKNIQSSVSGAHTAVSTGYASNFHAFPRPSHRSHTAGKGYRNIDLQEHSFNFERGCRDQDAREAVQSPYVNGRRNKEYVNPTFHSSSFLTHNMTLRRAKTPEVSDFRNSDAPTQANATSGTRVVSFQTPREDVQVNRKIDFTVESARVEAKEPERRAGLKSVSIREPVEEVAKIERTDEDFAGQQKKLTSSKSLNYLEVCGGCHNWQLANEAAEARKHHKDAELEAERSVLDHNNKLLRSDKERERARKEMVVSTSRHNYNASVERKARNASREDEVDIKMENKVMAAESIRSLKRYQSMLDKMYESSMKRHTERKGDLNKSQSHNKVSIVQKEQVKTEEKQKGSMVKWNLNEGEKSLLDTMHERSVRYTETKDNERKIASEHNRQCGSARKEANDAFKTDAGDYERAGDGKSLLDKMYMSSLQYWQKQKTGLKDTSISNRETSALLKRKDINEQDMLAREYPSPSKPTELKGKSVLDALHHSDQKGLNRRKDYTVDCSGHNKNQGYSIESAQSKIKNLDTYYKSPARKINKGDGVDYDRWTEEGGVFQMISSSADKLHKGRRTQTSDVGSTIRQQMVEVNQRKTEEQTKDKNIKHTPLLVCSEQKTANCNVCEKKVPANKISKIIADYSKLAKGRAPRWNI